MKTLFALAVIVFVGCTHAPPKYISLKERQENRYKRYCREHTPRRDDSSFTPSQPVFLDFEDCRRRAEIAEVDAYSKWLKENEDGERERTAQYLKIMEKAGQAATPKKRSKVTTCNTDPDGTTACETK